MEQPRIDHVETPTKRSRREAGKRLPRLGLRPLDPARRLLPARPRKYATIWTPEVNSDLISDLPISMAELDAILQLLGDDLASVLDD